MLKERASATFMGGQVAFLGVPGTIEGTAVIDGYLSPPEEIGPLENPIVLKMSKGRVVNIDGCPSKSLILSKWLDGKEKGIEHFCIGFNPGARLSGNIVEAERAFGHIVIGLGKYPFHTDGIIKNPQLILDNKVILKNNTFIHDDLFLPSQNLFRAFDDIQNGSSQ
jgi:leucyl aminopeptidase (aminopeptidase T)